MLFTTFHTTSKQHGKKTKWAPTAEISYGWVGLGVTFKLWKEHKTKLKDRIALPRLRYNNCTSDGAAGVINSNIGST